MCAYCGVRTNITTRDEIPGGSAAHVAIFSNLVQQTKENFSMHEIFADNAYLSEIT